MRHILFRDGATRSGEVVDIDPALWQAPEGVVAVEFPEELGRQPLDYILQGVGLVPKNRADSTCGEYWR